MTLTRPLASCRWKRRYALTRPEARVYPLEIYPVVQACVPLEPGFYHYDPLEHRLARLSGLTSEVLGLIERAGAAAAVPGRAVQVLLVVAARFQRVAWKYSSLAYSLILKDLGGLMQTMYLAATAMGLAPCAGSRQLGSVRFGVRNRLLQGGLGRRILAGQ